MRFRCYGLIAYVLPILLWSPAALADEQTDREYSIKAGFLFNFTKFVDWPDSYSLKNQKDINICVAGDSPISRPSEALFGKASTASLHFTLLREGAWKGRFCHILFIAQSRAGSSGAILSGLDSKPTLTVSEADGFADNGGAIEFLTEDNKVKLIINVHNATVLGLKIDAQLLEIAKKVIR